MDDLSFELNAPMNLKSKQTGSRKKFPELSSKNNTCNKENKKPPKSIKLWDPNEDIKKFLTNKKPTSITSIQDSELKSVEKSKKENFGRETKVKATNSKPGGAIPTKTTSSTGSNKVKSTCTKPVKSKTLKSTCFAGYVSSNESYKSTTYEFSGNSKDGSANISDDSLVKIFKSQLPTSVKINKILTPSVKNVKCKSTGQPSISKEKKNQGTYHQKSKKLDFAEEKSTRAIGLKEKYDRRNNPQISEGKSSKLPFPEQLRYSINFRNSTDFNTFATPLKTTNSKISTPTEPEGTPQSRNLLQDRCIKSPLAQNEDAKRQKVQGENFTVHRNVLSKQNNTKRSTRNTSKQKPVVSYGLEKHNSILFTLSNKSSESRSSSLSPSPVKNCHSSLFSTISMESKESHDSSGSVYVSATDSLTSTTNGSLNDKNSKECKRSSKEKDSSINMKQLNHPISLEKKGQVSIKKEDQKYEKDDSKQVQFNARQLRSRNNGDSLFTSISSNESISVIHSSNIKKITNSNIESRKQNESSFTISGIEKLNLTEEGKESLKLPNKKGNGASRTSIISEMSNHSSLFSSINSNVSKNEENKVTSEVITISSDSSFDIDASFSELNIKETIKESIECNESENSVPSKPNSKIDTFPSLYSTMGNANLTSGVRIRKSKYFFNSSDKSISSIGSEPSCIESSIMTAKVNAYKKIGATPELDEAKELNLELTKENLHNSNFVDHSDNQVKYSSDKVGKNEKTGEKSKPLMKSKVQKELKKSDERSHNIDAIFDKTKVFDGKKWVDNVENDNVQTSFKFKEPTNQNEVDLSTWGKNSRGNVKIKVDRYSLNFNFNKLIGKTETTSTETLENFSSDVKHYVDPIKRKSFNRESRKSIEIKRSIAISSDSEADTDDEIRVVSKARRKQRILDSSDENSGSSAKAISSNESDYEDIRPKSKDKKTKKCPLVDLTNEFDELLTITKKPTKKGIPSTPKIEPPIQDKKLKRKEKQLTAVPNTPIRNDKVSKANRLTFLDSLSDHIPDNCIPHPEAGTYKSKFKSKKEELSRRLFHLYNKEIFGQRLPPDMPLEWNGRMRTTSGFCYNKRMRSLDPSVPEVRSARIALSKKILDRPDRLRDTLVHELCHAASWLIDGVRDGHGPNWRKWTIYAMQRFPELPPIKRCHEYTIDTKYVYRCSQCDYEFGRHSKSLNLERQVCGYCHGKFILLTNTRQGQTQAEPTSKRPPTQFAMFVKENYAKVKQENPGIKHGDVMRLLSKKFAESKAKDT